MKLTINIDCTPEEARSFFGLPDLTSVHKIITKEMEKQAKENLDSLADPARLMEKFYSTGGAGMEQMQAAFATMMAGMAGDKPKK